VSTHTFAYDPAVDYYTWHFTLDASVRPPATFSWGPEGVTLTYTPDLTAAEVTRLGDFMADIATMAHFGVTMTLAEWQAIKADAAGLRAYLGVASPTAAQTAAAVKAIVRVLGTIIRE
jgi:lipopolysaccharide biosynthesis protein